MTTAPEKAPFPLEVGEGQVGLTIDGLPVVVDKGTLLIRAAEQLGIAIPRFCDHPLLDPVGACRQCIVEVEGDRKPAASCTVEVRHDMVVKTQLTSGVAEKAQRGTMELLLANHPLDCPVCDKGGECPLQNQAMENGRGESRYHEPKRTYEKPLPISSAVLLDRERCVLCARCTRFSQQIAGDPFIELYERGALEQVGVDPTEPFHSYFSGNTVQICPVGALTSAAYRFRSRPFDIVSTETTCEHCASGCSLRVDTRLGKVIRRQAADDPSANEEWSCDKGRWAFHQGTRDDRLSTPLIGTGDGQLEASWTGALTHAAALIGAGTSAAVLTGGRLTGEDCYALGKLARSVLGTDDVDFRARPGSAEELDFLRTRVACRPGVTYTDLDTAPQVVLVGFEPEDESPIVFLRLRKAVRTSGLKVVAVAPLSSRGLTKLEAQLVTELSDVELAEGAIVLVGERAGRTPGLLSQVAALGARTAWIPRRAGDRGAIETGLLPGLLPGGRPLTDPAARAEVADAWGIDAALLPTTPGRSFEEILQACVEGTVDTLIVAGVDPADLSDPELAWAAFAAVRALIVLDVRETPLAQLADVVLPVAPAAEREGTYVDWEGRVRPLTRVLVTNAVSDLRVAQLLAAELGVDLGLPDVAAAQAEMAKLGPFTGERPAFTPVAAVTPREGLRLETWRQLIDDGTLSDGDSHLANTARPAVARMSASTAAGASTVTVTLPGGAVTVPVEVVAGIDGVVWLPTRARCADGTMLDVTALGGRTGSPVTLRPAGQAGATVEEQQ